nr:DUF87 domain-containing protein [Aestuariibacter sp. A3R04]
MHTAVCMMTGAGKGIALNALGLIPDKYPVVIFDPHGEHNKIAGRRVYQYKTQRNFAKTFIKAWNSGRPFALGYCPDTKGRTEKESKQKLQNAAEWFAKLVWAAGDGNRVLYSVFEEYGEYCESTADDNTTIGKIWTGGRKFGLRGIAVFQRSATISKTIWGNSPRKVIGAQGYENDIARCVDAVGCSRADMVELAANNKALQMYHEGLDEMVRTKVHYLFSESVGVHEKVAAYVKPAANLRKKWNAEQRRLDKLGVYKLV